MTNSNLTAPNLVNCPENLHYPGMSDTLLKTVNKIIIENLPHKGVIGYYRDTASLHNVTIDRVPVADFVGLHRYKGTTITFDYLISVGVGESPGSFFYMQDGETTFKITETCVDYRDLKVSGKVRFYANVVIEDQLIRCGDKTKNNSVTCWSFKLPDVTNFANCSRANPQEIPDLKGIQGEEVYLLEGDASIHITSLDTNTVAFNKTCVVVAGKVSCVNESVNEWKDFSTRSWMWKKQNWHDQQWMSMARKVPLATAKLTADPNVIINCTFRFTTTTKRTASINYIATGTTSRLSSIEPNTLRSSLLTTTVASGASIAVIVPTLISIISALLFLVFILNYVIKRRNANKRLSKIFARHQENANAAQIHFTYHDLQTIRAILSEEAMTQMVPIQDFRHPSSANITQLINSYTTGGYQERFAMPFAAEPKYPSSMTTNVFDRQKQHLYNDIKRLDDTAVLIENEYYHGNYVHGYKFPKTFIACEAPTVPTAKAFLKMLLQEEPNVVTTLCRPHEVPSHVDWYSPQKGNTVYLHGLAIKTVGVTKYDYAKTAAFSLRLQGPKHKITGQRETYHSLEVLRFAGWHDMAVPGDVDELLFLICLARRRNSEIEYNRSRKAISSKPIVVHCNAGVGRTGTFIAMFNGMEALIDTQNVDFLRILRELRAQRAFAIQKKQQFACFLFGIVRFQFIHRKTIEEPPNEEQVDMKKLDLILKELKAAVEEKKL